MVELERHMFQPLAPTYAEESEMTARGAASFGVQVADGSPSAVNLDVPSYTPLPIDLDDPPAPPAAEDPLALQRRLLVVSVPEGAEQIDLVVTSAELEQRLSLLTGEAGSGNVAVLARANRGLDTATAVPQEISYTGTEFGLAGSNTATVGIAMANLQWSVGSGPERRTAAPGRAILQLSMDTSGINWNLATELRLADGTVVLPMSALNETTASFDPTVHFDVPADFTSGTLVVGKDYTWEVPTGGGSFVYDFAALVEFPVNIPLEAAA